MTLKQKIYNHCLQLINDKVHQLQKVLDDLKLKDIRGFLDERDEKIGRKIRDAEVSKVPYMLIVGEKEAAENKVAVRKHGSGDQGVMGLEEFAVKFVEECAAP